MSQKIKWITGIAIVVLIVIIGYFTIKEPSKPTEPVKIGVITPLTGDVAYWGESSLTGVELAKRDLEKQGINAEFIIEDGQIDSKISLDAAQKLVNLNNVDAVYAEFTAPSIAVASFLEDKDVLYVYDAVAVSPLKKSNNFYKTYLDYEMSCRKVSQIIKNKGISKVGVLKPSLEFGDLCLDGIRDIFGTNTFSEEYNIGDSDFRTQLVKLKSQGVQALFNVSYPSETFTSFRQAKEMGMDVVFVGLSEIVSSDIADNYLDLLEGAVMFGLPAVSEEFKDKVKEEFPEKSISDYNALALTYLHLKQITNALNDCSKNLECVRKKMDNAKPEPLFGFMGFKDHIAEFDVLVQEWKNGEFVDIQ